MLVGGVGSADTQNGNYANVEVVLVCPECGSQNIMFQHEEGEEYFICLDCGEFFQQPVEKEVICKLGLCEFCGRYTKLVIHHMNMDRSDNRTINIARICKYCHGMFHGLLNQIIPDTASQRETIYMLQELGLNKKEILEALKQATNILKKFKDSDVG